jgi:hypothetical protein
MSFQTVSGTTLGVRDPDDAVIYFAPGFDAFTTVGEVTEIGGGLGRQYNTYRHAPIATTQQTERKASFTFPPVEMRVGWDDNDTGQSILRDALRSNDVLTFQLTKQDGTQRYFTAQISKLVEDFGTVDNVVQGAVTLLIQSRPDTPYIDLWFRMFA